MVDPPLNPPTKKRQWARLRFYLVWWMGSGSTMVDLAQSKRILIKFINIYYKYYLISITIIIHYTKSNFNQVNIYYGRLIWKWCHCAAYYRHILATLRNNNVQPYLLVRQRERGIGLHVPTRIPPTSPKAAVDPLGWRLIFDDCVRGSNPAI